MKCKTDNKSERRKTNNYTKRHCFLNYNLKKNLILSQLAALVLVIGATQVKLITCVLYIYMLIKFLKELKYYVFILNSCMQ